jgi:hypothetical protein
MAVTTDRIEQSARRVSRTQLAFAALLIGLAIAAAFLIGRTTAPTAAARERVRPVQLTASLHTEDGDRRVAVMRKMNSLLGS